MNVDDKFAREIIKEAKERLWDGQSSDGYHYCCFAVTCAVQEMTGKSYCEAKFTPEVVAIHAWIKQEICGESTLEDYLVNWCNWKRPLDPVIVQRSRQELLDTVARKYFGG